MIRLAGDDLEAVYYAVAGFIRHQQLSHRPVPPPVLAVRRSLELGIAADGNERVCDAQELEQVLSTEEAAEILGCTPRNVRYLARDLDARKVGRTWVYPKQVVEEHAERLAADGRTRPDG